MNKQLRDLVEIIQFTEKVSAKIHGLLDEAKIFQIVKKEFAKSKKYTVSILLSSDNNLLRIRATSMSPNVIKTGEKLARFRLKDYEIDLNRSSIYSQVIKKGRTVRAEVKDIIGELFPRPIAYLISKKMGYERSECIITPLRKKKKIIGALAMSSTELAEYFTPSVKNLAQHISNALDLASECAEHKKTGEALRKAHDELEKRVEERTKELQESEERFHTLVQTATDAIITIDSRGNIVLWNKAAETIFGYSAHKIIGKPLSLIIPKRFCEANRNILQRAVSTGKPKFVGKTSEFFGLRKDGSEFPLELSLATWKTQQGVFFTSIIREITDRKRAEEELKKSKEQLKAYSESLERTVKERTEKLSRLVEAQREFIAYMGHELRTPMSVIKAVVETELDDASKPLDGQLKLINKKVDQITQILKNLMLVSRLDIGQEKLYKNRFELRHLLKEVLNEVVSEGNKEGINAKVSLRCPKAIKLNSDKTKLIGVLTNLLHNSIFHSNNKPHIYLKAKKTGDNVRIIVEDNNQPIPKKDLEKIFEKFYRGKQARNKTPGVGLGLYICKRLVELMKGKIWVETKKGRGNQFVVELPVSS